MNSKIYFGEVSHARLSPVKHSFRYPVYFYAFVLDELSELARQTMLFGYNQPRPVAIHDKDYLTPGDAPINEKLEEVLKNSGWVFPLGKVVLVTAARFFNYIFNPISFFYCHDPQGVLVCVVAQVRNTFGEMHLYLLDAQKAERVDGRLRFRADKQFHVSPFFPRQGRYEFRLTEPGEAIDNTLNYHVNQQLALIARIHGQAKPLTRESLVRTILAHPFCASLTMPRILWQAAKLHWQRRLPVYHKPVPNSAMTVRPVPATFLDRIGIKMVTNFLSRLPQGAIEMTTPDSRHYRFGETGSSLSIRLSIKEFQFFRRIMLFGDIGFGEAYTDGDWTTSDLPGLLTLLAKNEDIMNDRSILSSLIGRLVNYLRHLQRPNTVRGSARNIKEHYDLSNSFFATFLDETMTYSCAQFLSREEPLEQAQKNKLRSIIEKAGINAEDHVLEIGCGWGSFAIEAVQQTGCRVTGITVSREQLEFARQRVLEVGLEDRIDLKFCDYRHIEGQYSKIVSIEMLEAVGHAGLRPFFAACESALTPGGRAMLQVITIPDRKYTAYRYSSDWIRKHIFPGGHVPSIGAMTKAMAEASTLQMDNLEQRGLDYAETIDRWRRTLLARRQEILDLGYDDAFLRKWEYYFAYCQAGFAANIIDLAQIVLTKPEHS
jgi:cyclopropane-fatty-acyl-phospholipid synthase